MSRTEVDETGIAGACVALLKTDAHLDAQIAKTNALVKELSGAPAFDKRIRTEVLTTRYDFLQSAVAARTALTAQKKSSIAVNTAMTTLVNEIGDADKAAADRIRGIIDTEMKKSQPTWTPPHDDEGWVPYSPVDVEIDESKLPPGVTADEIRTYVTEAYGKSVHTLRGKSADEKITIRVEFGHDDLGADTPAVAVGTSDSGDRTLKFNKNMQWTGEHRESAFRTLAHEVVHAAQAVDGGSGNLPSWMIEGMADHETLYDLKAQAPAKDLPNYGNGKTWNAGYENTAQMLEWIKQTRDPAIIDQISSSGRENRYSDQLLINAVGGGVTNMDEVWNQFLTERQQGGTLTGQQPGLGVPAP